MRHHLHILNTLLFFTCIPNLSLAAGIEQTYHDPQAAARGNAFVATADNASAVHYNPAGLVWADSVTSQAMLYLNRGEIKHSRSPNSFEHTNTAPSGSYFLNYPGLMDGKLALALGVTVPHGLGVEYDDNYPLRTLGHNAYLAHLVISPAASFKINDKLSAGMTLNYAHDDYQVDQGIIAPGDNFNFTGSGIGWGYSLGIMYKPTNQWSFGANYRSSIKTSIKGTAHTQTVFPTALDFSEPASTGFDYPQQIVIGAAYRPDNHWLIELNLTWNDWSSFDSFELRKASGDLIAPQNYKDTIVAGIGVQKKINELSNYNFGYLYSTAAAPAETYSPFVINSDLHVLSMGYDYKLNHWLLSSTLLYTHARTRTIKGSPSNPVSGANSDGKWASSGFILMLGATRTF